MTKEPEIVYPSINQGNRRFFGVPLEILMGENGERGIPIVVSDAIDYLFLNGLQTPDLFRRNVKKQIARKIKSEYELQDRSSVAYGLYGEYAAASILKIWVSELPQPIIPLQLYELVRSIPSEQGDIESAIYIRDILLPAMGDPKCTLLLLLVLVKLLDYVSQNSQVNGMTPMKLAIAWAPCWVHSSMPDLDVEIVSATRFKDVPSHDLSDVPANQDAGQTIDGESETILTPKKSNSPSNVVTLIRLMIEHYDMVFKQTQDDFSKNSTYGQKSSANAEEGRPTPPPKPKRKVVAATQSSQTDTSLPRVDSGSEVFVDAINDSIEQSVETFDEDNINVEAILSDIEGSADFSNADTKAATILTADEIAKRILEEDMKESSK
ncbi:putative Rho GTPase-activating protein [Smittium culicis]|uniref:Putative Rho GTPase-activating protein n=1 Tax=Smittium culicis TaxID=133412 RepID=A0A1R1YQ05_9FUNG|nr:putative Rho GTPase-activating protein [Smittium culicis]